MWMRCNTYAALMFSSVTMALLLFGCGGGGGGSTPSAPVYTISGKVIYNGSGVSGVRVTLAPAGTPKAVATVSTVSTLTNSLGIYSFTNVSAGNYNVASDDTTYGFSPQQINVTSGVNTVPDIPAYPVFSITGKILYNNISLPGVTVTITGGGTAVTGSDGGYVFTGLQSGSYTLTPALAGYVFQLPSIGPLVVLDNKTNQDFTASIVTYAVTGKIIDSTGNGIPGVRVSASPTLSQTTDSTGSYTFNVAPGTYAISSTDQKYIFNPLTVPVVVSNAGKTIANIVATPAYTISGTITRTDISGPLANVAVALYKISYSIYTIDNLNGANNITRDTVKTATATTNASGTYTLSGVAVGNYTIVPDPTTTVYEPDAKLIVFNPTTIEVMSISADGKLYQYDSTKANGSNLVTADNQIIYNSGPFTITDNNVVGQNFNASISGGSSATPKPN